MLIDLDSYIRQILPPTWRDAQSIGLAKVLFQPIVALFRKQEKYQEEVFFRAGLTGQKIVLEYYLQSVVDGRITIQDEDGAVVDFSVIVPSTLSASQEKQVYDIVSAYKLGGKRFEVRDVFASVTLPEEPSFMEWTTGFPKLEGSTLFAAVSQTGSFITRVRYQGNSLYLIDGAYNYQAGVAVNLGDYRLDRTIEVQVGELSAVIQPRPEYALEISGVEKIPGNADGAWRINLSEAYKGQRNFTIEWYKGTATVPISTYSTGNIDTNQVSYLYFDPKQDDPWKILSNGPSAYRVVVKVTIDGLNYSDEANATFTAADLGGTVVTPTLPDGGIAGNAIDKALLILNWGGSWGNNEVLWSDGSYHNGYWFSAPQSAIPSSLSVSDFPKIKGVVDYWAAKQGTSITMPVYWDRAHPADGVYIFQPIRWALQYAATKGLKVNFFLNANRRWTADPAFNTCTSWTFNKEDAEVDESGKLHGEPWNHMPALGSPKWENWYAFVTKFAEAIAEFPNVGWIAGACNATQEWGTLYEENSTSHPSTIAAYNAWHVENFGISAPAIAKVSDPNGINKQRTGKFHSWILMKHWVEAVKRIKTVKSSLRCVYHMSSATDETFRRTHLTTMAIQPNFMDGVKHNPARAHDEAFAIRAIARAGKMAIIEWTNAEGITASEMADNFKIAIDNGASGISPSFFEDAYKDIGGQADTLLSTVVTTLKNDGYWSKTYNYNNTNTDEIEMSAVTAMGANGGDYEQAYLAAFNASKASHSGALPSLKFVDDIGGGTGGSPNPNPNPSPDPVANNASIESASDWQTTTIRAKLTGTPQGSYNIRVLRNGNEVATAVATYGSNGYVEFSFPSVVSGQDLRGQALSFVFSGSTSQTIEYFLPRLVFREFTPNYSNFADDRIFVPRHTKTFDGRHFVADIGENRGWSSEYFIDGGNGGDVSVLPSVPLPVETRIEIMKNIIPTNVERYDVGPNYAITALVFWVKVRPNYTPKGLWTDEGPIGIPRMLLDANAFVLPPNKKYNMAFGGKLTGPTNEQLDRVSWARNIQDVPLWWYVNEIKTTILSMGVTEGEGGFHTWAATSGGRLQQFADALKAALNAQGRKIIITDWEPGQAEAAPYAWMWSNTSATAQVQWVQTYLAGFGMQFYEWHQGNSFTYNDKVYEMVSPSGHFNYYSYRPSNNSGYFHNADDYIDLFANLGSVSYPAVAYARGGSLGYNNVTISTENSYTKPGNKKYHAVPNILYALMTTNFFSLKVPNAKLIAIQWFCEDQNNRRSMTQHRFKPNPSMQGFVRGFDIRYVYSQNLIEDFCLFEFLSRNVYLQHIWSTASNCDPNVALWFATRNGQASCGSGVSKDYNFEGPDNYACPTTQDTYIGMEGAQHEARVAAGERYDKYKAICDGVNNQLFLSNAFEYRRSGQSTWTSVAASNGDEHPKAWKYDQPFLTIWKNSVSNKYVIFFWDLFAIPYTPVEFRFVINGTTYTRIANGNRSYDEAF